MAELRLVFQSADAAMTVRVDFSSADGCGISGGPPQPFAFLMTHACRLASPPGVYHALFFFSPV